MTLEQRNARALAAGQAAWDNASPPEDDGRDDYITAQAELLLSGKDADMVQFLTIPAPLGTAEGFDVIGAEAMNDADGDCVLLEIVLALRRRDFEVAAKMAEGFEDVLCNAARKMVEDAMEKTK